MMLRNHAAAVGLRDHQRADIIGNIIFFACGFLWLLVVLSMLPITVLTFPAHYFFKNKPRLHGDVAVYIGVIAAISAVIVPVFIIYAICT